MAMSNFSGEASGRFVGQFRFRSGKFPDDCSEKGKSIQVYNKTQEQAKKIQEQKDIHSVTKPKRVNVVL